MKITIKITKEIIEKTAMCGVAERPEMEYYKKKHAIFIRDGDLHCLGAEPSSEELITIMRAFTKWNNNQISHCQVSEAVAELCPTAKTYNRYISWGISGFVSDLPGIARQAISYFDSATPDQRREMKPFSFDVDFPDELVARIGLQQVQEILSKSTTLELA
jgi:hypothetical protein